MQFLIDSKITVQLSFKSEPKIPPVLELFEYCENIQQGLPTAKIALNCRDNDTDFISNSLYDGAPVRVKITHNSIVFAYDLNLAIFGTPSVTPAKTTNEGYQISLYCILDNYKYLAAIVGNSYKGSVSSVLTALAKECGLTTSPNLLQTTDSQVWLGNGRTYNSFAHYLVDHCYVSPSSLPVVGITHPSNLVLVDIVDMLKKDPSHTLSYQTKVSYADEDTGRIEDANKKNSYVFSTYATKNVAGLYNSTSSYGNTFLQESLVDANSFESSTVTFDRRIGNSEINKQTKTALKKSALNYMPLDTGNTYRNFYVAEAKNKRIRNLYSNVFKALTINEYTKIKLLDCVKVAIDLQFEDSKDLTYFGNYIVTAKTVNITRNIFREAITLTNYGRNMQAGDLL